MSPAVELRAVRLRRSGGVAVWGRSAAHGVLAEVMGIFP